MITLNTKGINIINSTLRSKWSIEICKVVVCVKKFAENTDAKDPKKNTDLLKQIIQTYLLNNKKVPQEYKPHQLIGEWKPHMECHIQSDFLLIWDIDEPAEELILVRCGSHSDLFG